MSRVVVLKIDSEDITEGEAITTIQTLAETFGLRITIGDRKRDEDQRFDVMDMFKNHTEDLQASVEKGHLVSLIDEDKGIIGYLLQGNEDEVLSHLNGTQ